MVTTEYVLARIDEMRKELDEFRKLIADPDAVVRRRKALYGVLDDVEFNEDEIEKARRSVLRDVDKLGLDD